MSDRKPRKNANNNNTKKSPAKPGNKSMEERIDFLEKRLKKLQKQDFGGENKPAKKKKLTEHNLFMRNALKKIKDEHPNLDHKEVFTYANKLWRQEKEGGAAPPSGSSFGASKRSSRSPPASGARGRRREDSYDSDESDGSGAEFGEDDLYSFGNNRRSMRYTSRSSFH